MGERHGGSHSFIVLASGDGHLVNRRRFKTNRRTFTKKGRGKKWSMFNCLWPLLTVVSPLLWAEWDMDTAHCTQPAATTCVMLKARRGGVLDINPSGTFILDNPCSCLWNIALAFPFGFMKYVVECFYYLYLVDWENVGAQGLLRNPCAF